MPALCQQERRSGNPILRFWYAADRDRRSWRSRTRLRDAIYRMEPTTAPLSPLEFAGPSGIEPTNWRASLKKTSVQKRPPRPKAGAPKQGRNSRLRRAKPSRVSREPSRVEAQPVDPEPVPVEAEPAADASDVVLSSPEARFAARVLPPEPERPFPARRHAVFFDVGNTSRPEHLSRVIDYLAIDWSAWRTDLVAVGNWKVIGRDTAQLLARHGAHLIHSAPSVGVSDWSDLRIAVTAGVWLASARPGDVVEIISNDRAFDAVGDVAASLGISFRRLTHQGLTGATHEAPVPDLTHAAVSEHSSRRRGRGRHRRPWRDSRLHISSPARPAPAPEPMPAPITSESG